jgi:hypothetical protein
VVAATRPGSGPLQMLNQAADSTDRIASLLEATTQPKPQDKPAER